MGRDGNFACATCKLFVYLGYGSYGTWLDSARTLEEYDNYPLTNKEMLKNKNVRRFLCEHEGHEIEHWSSDWTHFHGAILCYEGPGCNPILDMTDYTHEDWWNETSTDIKA